MSTTRSSSGASASGPGTSIRIGLGALPAGSGGAGARWPKPSRNVGPLKAARGIPATTTRAVWTPSSPACRAYGPKGRTNSAVSLSRVAGPVRVTGASPRPSAASVVNAALPRSSPEVTGARTSPSAWAGSAPVGWSSTCRELVGASTTVSRS